MPLSDEDRLRLENEVLTNIVQRFAGLRPENPYVARHVEKAREALSLIKRRKKALRIRDEVEEACFHVVNRATDAGIEKPVIVLQRFSKNDWECFIEPLAGVDPRDFVGSGSGSAPVSAIRDLLSMVKSYAAKCKSG